MPSFFFFDTFKPAPIWSLYGICEVKGEAAANGSFMSLNVPKETHDWRLFSCVLCETELGATGISLRLHLIQVTQELLLNASGQLRALR